MNEIPAPAAPSTHVEPGVVAQEDQPARRPEADLHVPDVLEDFELDHIPHRRVILSGDLGAALRL